MVVSEKYTSVEDEVQGRARRQRRRGTTLHAYYRTRAWYGRRAAVRTRARGRCEFCRVRAVAHVHHRTYADFGKEPLAALMGCCAPCHAAIHGRRRARTPLTCAAGSLLARGDSGRGISVLWTRYLATVKGA